VEGLLLVGECFVVRVGDVFGEWTVVVIVEVPFVDAGLGDATGWVDENVPFVGFVGRVDCFWRVVGDKIW